MENASKALIIAGAILIAILLISLGVMMFNASKGTTEQAENTSEVLEGGAKSGVLSLKKSLGSATAEEFFSDPKRRKLGEWLDDVKRYNKYASSGHKVKDVKLDDEPISVSAFENDTR